MIHRTTFALLLTLMVTSSSAIAQDVPDVDPRTDQLLRLMGEYLAGAQQFSFSAHIGDDDVLPTGMMAEFRRTVEFVDELVEGLQAVVGGHRGIQRRTLNLDMAFRQKFLIP